MSLSSSGSPAESPLPSRRQAGITALPAGLAAGMRPAPPPLACPLAGTAIAAGFPSPADDYIESRIDLNVELIPRPLSTFFLRVEGNAMRGDGIVDGDLLVVDRSLRPRPGMVVVVTHAGGFLLRRLRRQGDRLWLVASDDTSPPLPLPVDGPDGNGSGPEIWGIAIHAVHHLMR